MASNASRTGANSLAIFLRMGINTVKENSFNSVARSALTGAAAVSLVLASLWAHAGSVENAKTTVVLVHGAFADGSGWDKVIPLLQTRGFNVVAVQNPLTNRECEVLRAVAEGLTTDEIAGRLFLSQGTVRNQLSAAMRKTGSRSRWEAVRRATDAGWI